MKKILALLICSVMLLGMLAGCGDSEAGAEVPKIEAFSVGYAKADISPKESVPLRGYGDALERFSTGFSEPLYATCVAFADTDGQKVILIAHDLTNSPKELTEDIRKTVSEETGVPFSNILITASHSHSSPDYSQTGIPAVITYNKFFQEQCIQGAKDALADLAPATMKTGFDRVDGLNTVRHYLLTDGSYQGRAVGTVPKNKLVGHHSKVDNLLQVVQFDRGAEKDPVVLVNWCGHPRGQGDALYTMASPNYPGILRDALNEKYGCQVAFVLSGSGNVNNGSQIASDIRHSTYVELGQMLAEAVGVIIDGKLTDSKVDKIHLEENIYNHMSNKGYDMQIPLYAFSIGDWACVTAPFEIFDTNAMAVRDASKFKMTFYASCANEGLGYLPTPPSYHFDITYEAEITKFPEGTSTDVQDQLIQMLDNIFTASGNEIVDKGEGYNTPEFVPSTNDVTYYRLSEPKEVKNGFYAVGMSDGAQFSQDMLCIDKETADKVAALNAMKLVFNEQNVIVDVIPQ